MYVYLAAVNIYKQPGNKTTVKVAFIIPYMTLLNFCYFSFFSKLAIFQSLIKNCIHLWENLNLSSNIRKKPYCICGCRYDFTLFSLIFFCENPQGLNKILPQLLINFRKTWRFGPISYHFPLKLQPRDNQGHKP